MRAKSDGEVSRSTASGPESAQLAAFAWDVIRAETGIRGYLREPFRRRDLARMLERTCAPATDDPERWLDAARLCSLRMSKSCSLLLLLAACTQVAPRRGDIPIEAIRACLRQECEDQGLGAMAIAIAFVDGGDTARPEVVEIAWGSARTVAGETVDPVGMSWCAMRAVEGFGSAPGPSVTVAQADAPRTIAGGWWSYGIPPSPPSVGILDAPDAPRSTGTLAAMVLDIAAGGSPSRAAMEALGNSSESMRIETPQATLLVATDRAPAGAALHRVLERCAALLRERTQLAPATPLARVDRTTTRSMVGRFGKGSDRIEILEVDGEPWLVPERGPWMHLRQRAEGRFVARDLLNRGVEVDCDGARVLLDGERFMRSDEAVPELPTDRSRMLGRYLATAAGIRLPNAIVLERHGMLRIITPDDLVERRLTDDELPALESRARLGELALERAVDSVGTFRIQPVHTPDRLRVLADAATPPTPARDAWPFDLVELRGLDPTIHYDIRYATDDNFMGFPLYDEARARLQRPAAEGVLRAHHELAKQGYGVVVHDAWRPWRVTKMFWDATPEAQHTFVADPSKGSRHNRGCAIDLSLYELETGRVVGMPSGYDEFTERAYPSWPGATTKSRALRDLLRRTMEDQGFTVYEAEWWHFDFRDWQHYPVK